MGAIGGGIFQAVKGFRNAPSVSSLMFLWTFNQLLKFDPLPLSVNDNDALFRICIKSVAADKYYKFKTNFYLLSGPCYGH